MPRVVEIHNAVVSDNKDPEKRGRIRVLSPTLMGDPEVEVPEWVEPSFQWGNFIVPDIGEFVEVEVEVGTDSDVESSPYEIFIVSPDIRWRGVRNTAKDHPENSRLPDFQFTDKNYGKRRGFASPKGHVLYFDDTDGQESVSLVWKINKDPLPSDSNSSKVETSAMLTFDKDGSVQIRNSSKSLIYLNAKSHQTSIIDDNSNMIRMDSEGIFITDGTDNNNMIILEDGITRVFSSGDINASAGNDVVVQAGTLDGITSTASIKTEGAGDVTITATGTVNIDSGNINVGVGADSPFVRYAEWVTWAADIKDHTHTSSPTGGPTTGPLVGTSGSPLIDPPGIASTLAKVK